MTTPTNPSEDHLVALRDASRELLESVHNVGKRRSAETRAKIAKAMTGRKHSKATREKIGVAVRRAHAGKPKRQFSSEHRQNLSRALKGRRPSIATRAKIQKALTGRRRPESTKKKIGDALRGRRRVPERTPDQRRSDAMRASWVIKKAKAEHGGEIPLWLQERPDVRAAYDRLTTGKLPGER